MLFSYPDWNAVFSRPVIHSIWGLPFWRCSPHRRPGNAALGRMLDGAGPWRTCCTALPAWAAGDWQWMARHLFAVWARCGMLAQGTAAVWPAGRAGRICPPAVRKFFLRARTVFAALKPGLQDRTGTMKSSAPHRYRSGDAGVVRYGMGAAGGGRCRLCRAGAAGVQLVEQAAEEQYEIH